MGVSQDSILCLDAETKMLKETFKLEKKVKHSYSDKSLEVIFQDSTLKVLTNEGKFISDLLNKPNLKKKFTGQIVKSLVNTIKPELDRAKRMLASQDPVCSTNKDSK